MHQAWERSGKTLEMFIIDPEVVVYCTKQIPISPSYRYSAVYGTDQDMGESKRPLKDTFGGATCGIRKGESFLRCRGRGRGPIELGRLYENGLGGLRKTRARHCTGIARQLMPATVADDSPRTHVRERTGGLMKDAVQAEALTGKQPTPAMDSEWLI